MRILGRVWDASRFVKQHWAGNRLPGTAAGGEVAERVLYCFGDLKCWLGLGLFCPAHSMRKVIAVINGAS